MGGKELLQILESVSGLLFYLFLFLLFKYVHLSPRTWLN